eukprot:scaffold18891_cov135-Isochrysis_galbana.AAC.2
MTKGLSRHSSSIGDSQVYAVRRRQQSAVGLLYALQADKYRDIARERKIRSKNVRINVSTRIRPHRCEGHGAPRKDEQSGQMSSRGVRGQVGE